MKHREKNGIPLIELGITDSTNRQARLYAENGTPHGVPAIFVAEGQTSGRGRLGRSFFSPVGTGLYMTVLMHSGPSFSKITALSAVAVLDTVEELFGIRLSVKWVNDLFYKGKKVCGILAKAFPVNGEIYTAVGIGINISTAEFPEDVAKIAGSLGVDPEKKAQLARLTGERICRAMELSDTSDLMARYRERSCVIGKRIICTQGNTSFTAVAKDITDSGELVAELPDGGVRLLSSGEITLRTIE